MDLPVDTVRVVGGTGFTLALTADGDVWAWGDHRRGQLGPAASGANLGERVQITITGGHPVVAIDAANDHAIAVTADGRVHSWGGTPLEDATTTDRWQPRPVPLPGDPRVVGAAAGDDHVLALTASGDVYGWGNNAHGQLGSAAQQFQPEPVRCSTTIRVLGLSAARLLSRGGALWSARRCGGDSVAEARQVSARVVPADEPAGARGDHTLRSGSPGS